MAPANLSFSTTVQVTPADQVWIANAYLASLTRQELLAFVAQYGLTEPTPPPISTPQPTPPPSPPSPSPLPSGILLEDFSSMRMNGDSPAGPLWAPYTGSWSAGPGQKGSILPGGIYRDVVPVGQAPYFHFNPYPYNTMSGFAKGRIRSGTWSPSVNRLEFWMRVDDTGAVVSNNGAGRHGIEIGTYTKKADGNASNQGDHYYHNLYANLYPGRWVLVTLNRKPQHLVSTAGSVPENPTKAKGWDYFDGLTRFYMEAIYPDTSKWGGRSYDFADFRFSTVIGEPDALVASVTATYTGTKYELTWAGPNKAQTYTVYLSPRSMHVNGLAAGTKSATTAATTGNDYTGVLWASEAMAQSPTGMYFAILPAGQDAFTEIYLPVRN